MRPVLNEARVITIVGKEETFANYDDLNAYTREYLMLVKSLEAELDPDDETAWTGLSIAADQLAMLLQAQADWLEDSDNFRAQEEERIREAIRNLNL